MSFTVQLKSLLAGGMVRFSQNKCLNQGFLWGIGALVLCLGSAAQAADTVTLRYLDDEEIVPLTDLQTFALTGVPQRPELQEFAQQHPQVVTLVQDILTAEIYISPEFLEDTLDSSTGEFVLIQLNKFLSNPSRSGDLEPIRTALRASFEDDNRFTLLEVVEAYPESEILVDLSGLEPVYNDVKGFIEDVLPALEVAKGFLQDLVCECDDTSTSSSTAPGGSDGEAVSLTATSCVDTPSATTVNPENTAIADSETLSESEVMAIPETTP